MLTSVPTLMGFLGYRDTAAECVAPAWTWEAAGPV